MRSDSRLRLVFDRSLSLVCFVVEGEDERTKALIDAVNTSGRVLITQTRVRVGDELRCVARVAVGASSVREQHIDLLISEIDKALAEVVE